MRASLASTDLSAVQQPNHAPANQSITIPSHPHLTHPKKVLPWHPRAQRGAGGRRHLRLFGEAPAALPALPGPPALRLWGVVYVIGWIGAWIGFGLEYMYVCTPTIISWARPLDLSIDRSTYATDAGHYVPAVGREIVTRQGEKHRGDGINFAGMAIGACINARLRAWVAVGLIYRAVPHLLPSIPTHINTHVQATGSPIPPSSTGGTCPTPRPRAWAPTRSVR